MRRRWTIYGNWSAYDELSDGVLLTEELAMRQMQELQRLRSFGVRIDAYLMDAFWFDPDAGYRTWRKSYWPDGPSRWLSACAENDLIPGLWFTANTLCHLKPVNAWLDSADENGWGLCCFHGGFLADFLDVLDHWYQQGIRIFKLDFADFSAAPPSIKGSMPSGEIRTRNEEAMMAGLLGFRRSHPSAVLMGFNGFESKEYMDRTDRPLEAVFDVHWLDVFDSIYSGDPRPADVPAHPFWRSVEVYGDHTTRVLQYSGVPPQKIDNCGFMAGPTGTCYWRAKEMWKSSLLLTLARGGELTVLYGDLSLFDEQDAIWMAKALDLFSESRAGKAIGGIPGQSEPYGWIANHNLCAMVNPTPTPATIKLPEGDWKVLFRDDGYDPKLDLLKNTLDFGPFQFVLLGLGGPDLGIQQDCVSQPRKTAEYVLIEQTKATLVVETLPGDLRLIVRQRDVDGQLVRTYSGSNSASSAISITACQSDRELLVTRTDDKIVWSGMSWAIGHIMALGDLPVHIEIQSNDRNVEYLDLEIWVAADG